jgi:AcrR family transcriptional regulator
MTSADVVAFTEPTIGEAVLRKLKPGPGLSREAVSLDQKLRLRAALSSLAAESGWDAVTVRALTRRAGISTSTFYRHYESLEDCFAGVISTTLHGIADQLRGERSLDCDSLAAIRNGLRLLMERLAGEPPMVQAVLIEPFGAGPRVRGAMDSAIGEFEKLFAEALDGAPMPAVGTTHLIAGLVAGAMRIVRKTSLTGRAEQLPGLADEVTDWMLSVAHEEVVGFRAPRSLSAEGAAGRHLLWIGSAVDSRESIADSSHRAITTTARLVATNGLAKLTSARIRKDAGLSRSEFERHFAGVEGCFLDAIESISVAAVGATQQLAVDSGSWERWIYKTITGLCTLAARDQELARLVLLDITAPGRAGLLRREELIDRCVARIVERAPPRRRPPGLVVDASLGAIWRIAETEVAAGRTGQLPRIAPAFVYMVIAPRRLRAQIAAV